MPIYNAPTKDIQFVLHDLLKVSEQDIEGFDDLDRDFTSAVVEEAGKVATDWVTRVQPRARSAFRRLAM